MNPLRSFADWVKAVPQHSAERKLAKNVLAEYADDPDVEFVQVTPLPQVNAEHGVNHPQEMVANADPVAD